MLINKPNLRESLYNTRERHRMKGNNFRELYERKKSAERVKNHEGIKKAMLTNG